MKSKKSLVQLVLLIMSFVLIFSSTACRSTETPPTEQPAVTAPEVEQPEKKPYKIGIMTGTVSQGEEEYQEAMNQIAKYGDMIVHATYPDNFSTETETTISQVVQMASDPDVKAIVFVQAIPGAAAAIEKVHETRPDMLFIAGVPAEDPPIIAGKADIVMQVDEISMGRTIPEMAAAMGATTFIHYSFPRHLSYATIARRLEIMKETCLELGIELVEVNALTQPATLAYLVHSSSSPRCSTADRNLRQRHSFLLHQLCHAGTSDPDHLGKRRYLSTAMLPQPLPWLSCWLEH